MRQNRSRKFWRRWTISRASARHRRAERRHRAVCRRTARHEAIHWPADGDSGAQATGPVRRRARAMVAQFSRPRQMYGIRYFHAPERAESVIFAILRRHTAKQTTANEHNIMSDILNKILAVKADEVAAAKKHRAWPACGAKSKADTCGARQLCAASKAGLAREDRRRPRRRDRRSQESLAFQGRAAGRFSVRPRSPQATPRMALPACRC